MNKIMSFYLKTSAIVGTSLNKALSFLLEFYPNKKLYKF